MLFSRFRPRSSVCHVPGFPFPGFVRLPGPRSAVPNRARAQCPVVEAIRSRMEPGSGMGPAWRRSQMRSQRQS